LLLPLMLNCRAGNQGHLLGNFCDITRIAAIKPAPVQLTPILQRVYLNLA
jgi:hypothetical protein